MPTIGLCMIVKNEAKLIRRCLDSVRPLIDYVCISDTGSTDETKPIIRAWLAEFNVPGVVRDHKWHDFATNRNLALQSLQSASKVDYAFMIDADDRLEIPKDLDIHASKAALDKDYFLVDVRHGSVLHQRPQIFRNAYPKTRWVGVVHEYLEVPPEFTRAYAKGLTIVASIEGSRNADPLKFQKDAEILEKALKTEKTEYLQKRYTFYLAQSYRDAESPEKARIVYRKRMEMGGWEEEIYVSALESIRCCIKIGGITEFDPAYACFEIAKKAVPSRSEAHWAMAFFCRALGKNREAAAIANEGLGIPMPGGGLFIEPWIYGYGLRDEFSINAYWAGAYTDSLDSCLQLLTSGKLPQDQVARIAKNAGAAFEKLRQAPTAKAAPPLAALVYSD